VADRLTDTSVGGIASADGAYRRDVDEEEKERATTVPRLHLHMRTPSPATYEAPAISATAWIFIAVGAISLLFFLLCLLSIVTYGFIAGDPG
jgi:hypothetical protein